MKIRAREGPRVVAELSIVEVTTLTGRPQIEIVADAVLDTSLAQTLITNAAAVDTVALAAAVTALNNWKGQPA